MEVDENVRASLAIIGRRVEDKVTGFAGTVSGVVVYLSGCHQALVIPRVDKDGKMGDANWFDVQRLQVQGGESVALDNGDTPGCDAPPPVR